MKIAFNHLINHHFSSFKISGSVMYFLVQQTFCENYHFEFLTYFLNKVNLMLLKKVSTLYTNSWNIRFAGVCFGNSLLLYYPALIDILNCVLVVL